MSILIMSKEGKYVKVSTLQEAATRFDCIDKTIVLTKSDVITITAHVDLPDGAILEGNGATIIHTAGNSCLIAGNNCTVRNVNFVGEIGANPFWTISADSKTKLLIEGCTFTGYCRIYLHNSVGIQSGDVIIRNNTFDVDYSGVDYVLTQYDVLSCYGQKNVEIAGNTIKMNNVHRCMKFSDAVYAGMPTPITPFNSRNITVRDNFISGTTTSNKQVIDLYINAQDTLISGNFIDVIGWGYVVECKAGGGFADGVPLNIVVSNNYMRSDSTIINFTGSVGEGIWSNGNTVFTPNPTIDNHPCVTNIIGNVFETDYIDGVIVRYYTDVNISNNKLTCSSAITNRLIHLSQSDNITVANNYLGKGIIYLTWLPASSGGVAFSGTFKRISITGNSIYDYDTTGAIWFNNVTGYMITGYDTGLSEYIYDYSQTNTCFAKINNNIVKPLSTGVEFRALFYSLDYRINTLALNDNVYLGTQPPVYTSGIVDGVLTSGNNSWNPATTYGSTYPVSGLWVAGSKVIANPPVFGSPRAWTATNTGGAITGIRPNLTAISKGYWYKSGVDQKVFECFTAGTTAAAEPSTAGLAVGDTFTDGTVEWRVRSLTFAYFVPESNYDIGLRTFITSPVGAYTPFYVGEEFLDTAALKWYKATGLTNVDWVVLN